MKALNFSHVQLPTTPVQDKDDFFRSGLPEMPTIKSLINVTSRLFKIPTTHVILSVVEEIERVYCITLLDNSVQKLPFGKLYYMPLLKRFEVYDMENINVPLHVWIKKKLEFTRTSILQQKAETHKSYLALINCLV